MPTTTRDQRLAQLDSARALLESEAALLDALRASGEVVSQGVVSTAQQDERSHVWEAMLLALLLRGRRRAKSASYTTYLVELEAAILAQGVALPSFAAPVGVVPADLARARHSARSLARRWRVKAALAEVEGAEPRVAARLGMADLQPHVEMVATTEAVEAFSAERSAVAEEHAAAIVAAAAVAAAAALRLGKQWEAVLDKRTCQICESMHGRIIRAHEEWAEGGPGAVHPRCRCYETAIIVTSADEWDADAAV